MFYQELRTLDSFGQIAADGSPEDVLRNPQIKKEVLGDTSC